MGVVPSSSPVYTPIKRRKKVELTEIQPVSLFNVQDSPPTTTQETQLAESEPKSSDTVTQATRLRDSAGKGAEADSQSDLDPQSDSDGEEAHIPSSGLLHTTQSAFLATQIPCSQPELSSVPDLPRPEMLPLQFSESFSPDYDPQEPFEESELESEPELQEPETVETETVETAEAKAGTAEAEKPEVETREVPNSQWWEETLPALDADETIDTDSDSNTQHYLKEILTESMVESLPLPSQQKRMAMNMSRGY